MSGRTNPHERAWVGDFLRCDRCGHERAIDEQMVWRVLGLALHGNSAVSSFPPTKLSRFRCSECSRKAVVLVPVNGSPARSRLPAMERSAAVEKPKPTKVRPVTYCSCGRVAGPSGRCIDCAIHGTGAAAGSGTFSGEVVGPSARQAGIDWRPQRSSPTAESSDAEKSIRVSWAPCRHCGGDGGNSGSCMRCSGSGFEPR